MIEILKSRPRPTKKETEAVQAGKKYIARPSRQNPKFFKIYRTNKNGNIDYRPILIPKKDCKIIQG
jgi:hypothetical protein